ncbi:hypothetical protein VMCG_01820 [Cytospora schulzeri]|uniref:Protein kinase domain-containing protein n=1 Tax=Cytospora schulzeri TaxID=448051 RepID=A0A423X3B8_9PEZI|nr:hypothetical protein VMCG_01820 [Valsa malicola]
MGYCHSMMDEYHQSSEPYDELPDNPSSQGSYWKQTSYQGSVKYLATLASERTYTGSKLGVPEHGPAQGLNHAAIKQKRPPATQSLPELRLPEPVDPVSDESVDQGSSPRPGESITSSLPVSIASSPAPTTPEFIGVFSSDGGSTVREPNLKESDQSLISRDNTATDSQNEASEIDIRIDRDARTGKGVPHNISNPGAPRLPSEKSTITDLGARGREIEATTERYEPTIPVAEVEEDETLSIEERLLSVLHSIPGHSEKKGFFPERTLQALVNESSVKAKLRQCFKGILDFHTIDGHTRKICGMAEEGHQVSFKKIFAILVLCEKLSAINLFINEKVTDQDLPLRKVRRKGRSPNIFSLARKNDSEGAAKPLRCFEDWSPLAIIKFEEWQWTAMAPFFHRGERKNVGHFVLQDQIPLPFTADSRYGDESEEPTNGRIEVEGGFSSVFKADIHPQQHGFGDYKFTGQSFAVKCLSSRNRDEFRREAEMLMKFSDDTHEHLISLLATYEQFKKFYLIFPWAGADLEDYWKKKNPQPSMGYETVRWMAKQCYGIAEALCKIHKYNSNEWKHHPAYQQARKTHQTRTLTRTPLSMFGRHGDIKPTNVLWFQNALNSNDNGTLKITDFGMTEINTSLSMFYEPNDKAAVSPSYRPPEFDLVGELSRSHDIWALGCLYLDFVAWLLGGWELVEQFAQTRQAPDPMWSEMSTDTFFEIVRCKDDDSIAVMVKETVSTFIDDLHKHERCTEYLHDFLNLIQMEMLVIKPPACNSKEKGL